MTFSKHNTNRPIIPTINEKISLIKNEAKILSLSFSISSIEPMKKNEVKKATKKLIMMMKTIFINFIL